MFGIDIFPFVVACLGGAIVLLGVGALVFQAGCALADVPGRSYVQSLGIFFVVVIVCLPLAGTLIWFAGRYEVDPNDRFGSIRIAATIGSLLIAWLLAAGIYAFFLAASLQKGLLIAGVELLLMGLLAALVSAVVLVVLAFVQIISRPPPAKMSLAPILIMRRDASAELS